MRALDDWSPTFPGQFLYYPGRRQRPPSLDACIAFVKEWRKQRGHDAAAGPKGHQ